MKRRAIILLAATGMMLGIAMTPASRIWAAPEEAALKSVSLSANPTDTELVLRVDGTYSYKTVQATPGTLFIDLAGAKAQGVARSQQWVNPVLSGCKVVEYRDDSGRPVVRIEVDTKQVSPFVVQKDGATLRFNFGKGQFVGATPAPAPVAPPERTLTRVIPPTPASAPLLVSTVSLDKQQSGETDVDVSTSRSADYRVTTLPSPSRLIVDIEGAQNTSLHKSYAADTAVLKAVRIAQFRATDPLVVRVVADLNGNPTFDVHTTPAGIRIELRPRGLAKSAPVASTAPVPPAKPAEIKDLEAAAIAVPLMATPKVAAPVPLTEIIDRNPAATPALRAEKHDIVRPDVQSTLPAIIPSRQAVAAPLPSPSSVTPEALRANHAAETLNLGKDHSTLAAQVVPPAGPNGPVEEIRPVYTGEQISLNLKDVDLKDFFRLIHEISGLNIIIDPNVSGAVTLVLDSVPWDQALDIVLKNNRLGKILEGNVLRIARVETLTAEQEGQTKLAAARMDAAPLVTVFKPINYAKAADISALLKTWAGGGALSRRGTVLVDARANTLIISDVQSQMPIIEHIVAKLDTKAKQVSIEARVVLATANFSRTLAASLLGGFVNNSTTATGVQGTNSTISIPAPTAGLRRPVTTVTPATAGGFGVAAITNVGANYFINAAISAAEERDQAKTISRPTIVTQNNVLGTVQQGVQIPIQTSINNTISVQYANATLNLAVTPQVTDDGNIFMIINVTNASVGAIVSSAGPSINTQSANTQVLVPDGGTVVFGGITVTSRSKAATYIPWLGSIPGLGHLFKTTNATDADQELLFFVSPKILPG